MPTLLRGPARHRRRGTRRLADARPGSTRPTGRTSPTARRSTSSPTPRGWPARSPGSAAPREADGYLRFVDYARELWRLERDDFIDRNLDRPRDLVTANLCGCSRRGGFGRLQPKVEQLLQRPADPADLLLPGDVRGRRAAPGAGPLRGDRLPRLRRRRLLPAAAASTRSPARSPASPTKHGVDHPLRHEVTPRRRRRAGRATGVVTRRRPTVRRRRRRAQPGPARRLPRPAARRPAGATRCWAGCGTRPRASCCTSGRGRHTARSPTTTSTSAGRGGRPSTRSSTRAG